MDIDKFEKLILSELDKIVTKILTDNLQLKISAKARAGAEISDYLEGKFVEYTKQGHKYFEKTESAPKGQTKNPWDPSMPT